MAPTVKYGGMGQGDGIWIVFLARRDIYLALLHHSNFARNRLKWRNSFWRGSSILKME